MDDQRGTPRDHRSEPRAPDCSRLRPSVSETVGARRRGRGPAGPPRSPRRARGGRPDEATSRALRGREVDGGRTYRFGREAIVCSAREAQRLLSRASSSGGSPGSRRRWACRLRRTGRVPGLVLALEQRLGRQQRGRRLRRAARERDVVGVTGVGVDLRQRGQRDGGDDERAEGHEDRDGHEPAERRGRMGMLGLG